MKKWLFIFLLLIAFKANAEINFDATSNGEINNTSLTFSHTISGEDRVLFVSVRFTGTDDLVSITFNGTPLTEINKVENGARKLYFYYLISPDLGEHDIIITRTTTDWITASAVSYTGASGIDTNTTNTSEGTVFFLMTTLNGMSMTINTAMEDLISTTMTELLAISGDNWFILGGSTQNGNNLTSGDSFILRSPTYYDVIGDSNGVSPPPPPPATTTSSITEAITELTTIKIGFLLLIGAFITALMWWLFFDLW